MTNVVSLIDHQNAPSWDNGRNLYYEGDDPDGFAEQVKAVAGFDPRTSPPLADDFFICEDICIAGCHPGARCGCGSWDRAAHHRPFGGYPFYCPAEHEEAVSELGPIGT